MLRPLLLVALLAGGGFAAEPAAPAKGAYALGVRAVYFTPADGERGTWNPGAQARYFMSELWAVEAAADYQRHLFPATTVHTAAGQVSLMRFWDFARLRPFVLGGAGYYLSRLHGPAYRRNLGRFGPHAGGGAEFSLNERWSVEAAYRHLWVGDIETRDAAGNARTYKRSGEQLSFALNRRF